MSARFRAEGLHIEGEEPGENFLDLPPTDPVRAVGPISYALDVGTDQHAIWATGTAAMDVELECVRCLEKFIYPLEAPEFAAHVDLEDEETADLTPLVREDMILALPAHPHCDWAGDKVCAGLARTASPANGEVVSAHDRRRWNRTACAIPRGIVLNQLKLRQD